MNADLGQPRGDEINDAVRRYLRRQHGRLVKQSGKSEAAGRLALWRLV